MFLENVAPGSPEACHIIESITDDNIRNRCIKTFMYQLIFYGSLAILHLIDKLIMSSMDSISTNTIKFFSYLSTGCGIILVLLMIFSFIFAIKGKALQLAFPLMVATFIFALLFYLGFDFSSLRRGILDEIFYFILPLILLSLGNLLWALFVTDLPFNIVLMSVLVIVGVLMMTLIDFFAKGTESNIVARIVIGIFFVFYFLLQSASWASAIRYTLRLK